MYFGSTYREGANGVVDQALEHAVQQHLGGFSSRIDVSVEADGTVTLVDDGRGLLPVRVPGAHVGDPSVLFGDLATVDPIGDSLMLAAACAVCDPFEVTLDREGRRRRQVYRRGRALAWPVGRAVRMPMPELMPR